MATARLETKDYVILSDTLCGERSIFELLGLSGSQSIRFFGLRPQNNITAN
jgi:hypothetical protein